MKNRILIDIDTDRELSQVVQIGKPDAKDLAKNKEEAKKIIAKDIACITEALVKLIQTANDSGYKNQEEAIEDVKTHLDRAFSDKPIPNVKVGKITNLSDDESNN